MTAEIFRRKPASCIPCGSARKSEPILSRRAVLATSVGVLFGAGPATIAFADTAKSEMRPILQPELASDATFIQRAFEMRQRAVDLGDQPYGAVVVRNGMIIGQSWSRVLLDGDPTAHAELAAIRDASFRTGNRNLAGAAMYSSSPPCPMCEAAAYWAGVGQLIHGRSITNAGPPVLCR